MGSQLACVLLLCVYLQVSFFLFGFGVGLFFFKSDEQLLLLAGEGWREAAGGFPGDDKKMCGKLISWVRI